MRLIRKYQKGDYIQNLTALKGKENLTEKEKNNLDFLNELQSYIKNRPTDAAFGIDADVSRMVKGYLKTPLYDKYPEQINSLFQEMVNEGRFSPPKNQEDGVIRVSDDEKTILLHTNPGSRSDRLVTYPFSTKKLEELKMKYKYMPNTRSGELPIKENKEIYYSNRKYDPEIVLARITSDYSIPDKKFNKVINDPYVKEQMENYGFASTPLGYFHEPVNRKGRKDVDPILMKPLERKLLLNIPVNTNKLKLNK